MSNLMPGDMSGAEPQEHYRNCHTNCQYIDHVLNTDKAFDLLYAVACDLSFWKAGAPDKAIEVMQATANQALDLIECPEGHRDHECNCEDIDNEEPVIW